ncbi:MAG: 2-dehydropantoate 2-reductase [Termitinemataceae bacterium]|nr:MAG: 2-dehydropantoate 2-reductase [Termitinemataceae bacterium]
MYKKIESVLIAGAGAIGMMVAGKIFDSGKFDMTILAEGERSQRYKEKGLSINGQKYNFKLSSDSKHCTFDLIIVACKFYSLKNVIDDIADFVGRHTIIVSLLNGITSENIIGAEYGIERLPLAMIAGNDSQHKETNVTYTQIGKIHFGDINGSITERDALLKDFWRECDFPFEYHKTDMLQTLWYKLMMNVGINQSQALFLLPYSAFSNNSEMAIPEAITIMKKAMREVIEIARAENIILNESDIENCCQTISQLCGTCYTSMCQDLLAGKKTEIELFADTVCEYGRKHNIKTPLNEMLSLAIRVQEKKNLLGFN